MNIKNWQVDASIEDGLTGAVDLDIDRGTITIKTQTDSICLTHEGFKDVISIFETVRSFYKGIEND